MRVIDAGHFYQVNVLDAELGATAPIRFVKRQGAKFPGNEDAYPGTVSQELLRILLHRAQYVQNQSPCWQTKTSMYFYGAVIWMYEHRAAKRHGRRAPGWREAIWGRTCVKCGHVGCEGGCR